MQAAGNAFQLDIIRPEFLVDPGKGIEDERGNGITAEEGNAAVIPQQGFRQRFHPGQRSFLCLLLQSPQGGQIAGGVVSGQLPQGRSFQIVAKIQNTGSSFLIG